MKQIKIALTAIISLIILILVIKGINVINSGTVGVEKVWGKINPSPIMPGIAFVNPVSTSIEKMSTKLTPFTADAHAASKDLQIVTTQVTVGVSIIPTMAPAVLSNVGNMDAVDSAMLSPAIQECVKAVTAQYSAENLIVKRNEAKKHIEDSISQYLNDVLKNKGIDGAIVVQSVAITDFNFSKEFNQAIESKVKAEQDALREVNEKTKRITSAEAAAREVELKATAESSAITATSIARAAAIQREAEALAKNPNIIELRKIEKWNGVLPVYTMGSAGALIQLPQGK